MAVLWEVLVNVRGEYLKAKADGNVLEWLAARLPHCFVRTAVGKEQHIEEPPGWEDGRAFDAYYDTLVRLAEARTHASAGRPRRAKPVPIILRPADERTVNPLLSELHPLLMIDSPTNGAELTFNFSAEFSISGTSRTLDEFWRVAFVSFFNPHWLPWRGSYCYGCGRPLPPTKKKGRASGTKLCSGCRVRKCRQEAKQKNRTKSNNLEGA